MYVLISIELAYMIPWYDTAVHAVCDGIAPTVATPTSVFLRVIQEARHNNLSLFRRLKQLLTDDSRVFIFFANEHHCETFPEEIHGESPNDRNDRAIRIATSW